jgi:hypothetical protein
VYDGTLTHFEDIKCVHDVDTFVGGMRKAHVVKNIQMSMSIHMEVVKGVVSVRSKSRMMSCIPWSESSVLYDANANDAPTPPPSAVPSPHPGKPWSNAKKVKKTLKDFYTGRHVHPVMIGPNAKREMLGFLRNLGQPGAAPPMWVDWTAREAANVTEPEETDDAHDSTAEPIHDASDSDDSGWAPFESRIKRVKREYTSESSASAESGESSASSDDDETLSAVRATVRASMKKSTYVPQYSSCEPHRGDIVEVYWEGDTCWYEGEVIESDDDSFEVHYRSDGNTLLHSRTDGIYKYRLATK